MLHCLGQAGMDEKILYLRALYEMWLARNNARDSHKLEEPLLIRDKVIHLTAEWRSIQDARSRIAGPRPLSKWTPLEEGWVKANADNAVAKPLEFGGGGAVLRDHHGAFLAGACHFPPLSSSRSKRSSWLAAMPSSWRRR